jgi:hypothetical protein
MGFLASNIGLAILELMAQMVPTAMVAVAVAVVVDIMR